MAKEAGNNIRNGPSLKRVSLTASGTGSSLNKNLTASAIGWNIPKGPTRLGPRRPWMKALRIADDSDVPAMIEQHPGATAILLDTWRADKPGGTGESFNWRQVPARSTRPLVLAGGLNAGNVGRAISLTQPFAVDVSGGVEESPGIKSREKIEQFVAAVRAQDQRVEKTDE